MGTPIAIFSDSLPQNAKSQSFNGDRSRRLDHIRNRDAEILRKHRSLLDDSISYSESETATLDNSTIDISTIEYLNQSNGSDKPLRERLRELSREEVHKDTRQIQSYKSFRKTGNILDDDSILEISEPDFKTSSIKKSKVLESFKPSKPTQSRSQNQQPSSTKLARDLFSPRKNFHLRQGHNNGHHLLSRPQAPKFLPAIRRGVSPMLTASKTFLSEKLKEHENYITDNTDDTDDSEWVDEEDYQSPIKKESKKSHKEVVRKKYRLSRQRPSFFTRISPYIKHLLVDPNIPYVLSLYVQLFLNVIFIAVITHFLYIFISTINNDINIKVEANTRKIQDEIRICTQDYDSYGCGTGDLVPIVAKACAELSDCIHQDYKQIGRAKVTAETISEIINGFIQPVSFKSLLFLTLLIFGSLILVNATFSTYRSQKDQFDQVQMDEKFTQPPTQYPVDLPMPFYSPSINTTPMIYSSPYRFDTNTNRSVDKRRQISVHSSRRRQNRLMY